MLFTKRQLQTTKWKHTKIHSKATGGVAIQISPFAGIKTILAFRVNPFNVNVVGDGCPVRQPFVTNLFVVEMKLTETQEHLALKGFSQYHSTAGIWRKVPESKYPELKQPVYDSILYLARNFAVNFHSL